MKDEECVLGCAGILWSGSSFQGRSLTQDAIFLCVCVCVCTLVYACTVYPLLSVCIYKPGGWVLEVCVVPEKALFRRTYQSPAFSPGLSSYDLFSFFHVLSFSCFYSPAL